MPRYLLFFPASHPAPLASVMVDEASRLDPIDPESLLATSHVCFAAAPSGTRLHRPLGMPEVDARGPT